MNVPGVAPTITPCAQKIHAERVKLATVDIPTPRPELLFMWKLVSTLKMWNCL